MGCPWSLAPFSCCMALGGETVGGETVEEELLTYVCTRECSLVCIVTGMQSVAVR